MKYISIALSLAGSSIPLLAQPVLVNGTFEQPSPTFKSQHIWKLPSLTNGLMDAGTMTIGSNPSAHNMYYRTFGPRPPGTMLLINALGQAHALVWSQNVGCLVPQKDYIVRG
jgi:hypothetical protein